MEYNNNLSDEIEVNPINSSQLSYSDNIEREGNLVSKITDLDSTRDLYTGPQQSIQTMR